MMKIIRTLLNFIVNEINKFSFILEPIFYQILFMSIIATVVGLSIFIILKFLNKEIYSKFKLLIWTLFILTLVCPLKLETNFSIYKFWNNIYDIPNISYREEYDEIKKENGASSIGYDRKWAEKKEKNPDGDFSYVNEEDILTIEEVEKREKNIQIGYIKSLIIDVIIPLLWISVFVLGILFIIIDTIWLNIKLKKYDDKNERINNILEKAKIKLNIKNKIKIIVQDFINVPSICGAITPKILIPKSLLENDDKIIEYAIMHELSHFKRKDIIVSNILLIIETLYWFNPLLWIFFKEIKNEIEVCTDEHVLDIISEEENKEYALSMIEIAKKYKKPKFSEKLICIVDGKKNLEKRIINIKNFKNIQRKLKYVLPITIISMIIIYSLFISEPKKNEIENEWLKPTSVQENISQEFPNPDRIVYKLDDGKYYIFNSKDIEYKKIIELLDSRITDEKIIANIRNSFSSQEIEDIKNKESFIELDYNSISKNYLFLLNNENFQMLKYTEYGAILIDKKLSDSNELNFYLQEAIKNKINYSLEFKQYLSRNLIENLHKESLSDLHHYNETYTYSKIINNKEDKMFLEKELNLEFNEEISNDIFNKNNIVLIISRSKITETKTNIGNIKLKISGEANENYYIYYLVVSKLVNSNCIYVEKGYENSSLYGSRQGKVLKIVEDTIYINRTSGATLAIKIDENTKIKSSRNEKLDVDISEINIDDEILMYNYYKLENSDAIVYGVELNVKRNSLTDEEIEKELLENRSTISGSFESVNLDNNYFIYKIYEGYTNKTFDETIYITKNTKIVFNRQIINIKELEEYCYSFISLIEIEKDEDGNLIATKIEFTDN